MSMKFGKIEASQMNLKRFISDDGVEITYFKPSQVREIPVKQNFMEGAGWFYKCNGCYFRLLRRA